MKNAQNDTVRPVYGFVSEGWMNLIFNECLIVVRSKKSWETNLYVVIISRLMKWPTAGNKFVYITTNFLPPVGHFLSLEIIQPSLIKLYTWPRVSVFEVFVVFKPSLMCSLATRFETARPLRPPPYFCDPIYDRNIFEPRLYFVYRAWWLKKALSILILTIFWALESDLEAEDTEGHRSNSCILTPRWEDLDHLPSDRQPVKVACVNERQTSKRPTFHYQGCEVQIVTEWFTREYSGELIEEYDKTKIILDSCTNITIIPTCNWSAVRQCIVSAFLYVRG